MSNTPKANPTTASPRYLLAEFLDARLSRPGSLETFLDRVAKALGRNEATYRNFVWFVRAGKKPIPEEAEEAWGRALGLLPDTPEWGEYARLVAASRAWGKANGREYVAGLETRVTALQLENAAQADRIRALTDRIAALEAEELDSGDPRF